MPASSTDFADSPAIAVINVKAIEKSASISATAYDSIPAVQRKLITIATRMIVVRAIGIELNRSKDGNGCFRSERVSLTIILPSCNMEIRCARYSANSRYCVVRNTLMPPSASALAVSMRRSGQARWSVHQGR